uniref:Uncharacterized protein n=1 Tax=uncultured bacterium A1Q1_fos_1870 TaxID=1256554 RepID=L7VY30_9BACT|nr:hypothetical protein [uncultured bacterium A1Q1_fos_1870]
MRLRHGVAEGARPRGRARASSDAGDLKSWLEKYRLGEVWRMGAIGATREQHQDVR